MFESKEFRDVWAPRLLGIVRILLGLLYMQHGLSKYFGFPGPAPQNFEVFSLIGLAGAIEVVGGLMVAVGIYTRWAAFIVSGEMAVAYFMVNAPRGFFPILNGGELGVLYCFVFLYMAVAGGGAWSADAQRSSRHGLAPAT